MSQTISPDAIQERFVFATELIRDAGALAAGYFADIGSLTVKNKAEPVRVFRVLY